MNKWAWSAALVALAAMGGGSEACTVNSTTGDDGGQTVGSQPDAATATDAGAGEDAVATAEGGAAGEAGDDGDAAAACPTLIDTGNAGCDQCIETSCCTQWVTCTTPDDAGVDDAGSSACVRLTQCVLDWVAADAGDIASGETSCDPAYTSDEQSAANDVLSCIQGNCATSCQ